MCDTVARDSSCMQQSRKEAISSLILAVMGHTVARRLRSEGGSRNLAAELSTLFGRTHSNDFILNDYHPLIILVLQTFYASRPFLHTTRRNGRLINLRNASTIYGCFPTRSGVEQRHAIHIFGQNMILLIMFCSSGTKSLLPDSCPFLLLLAFEGFGLPVIQNSFVLKAPLPSKGEKLTADSGKSGSAASERPFSSGGLYSS